MLFKSTATSQGGSSSINGRTIFLYFRPSQVTISVKVNEGLKKSAQEGLLKAAHALIWNNERQELLTLSTRLLHTE